MSEGRREKGRKGGWMGRVMIYMKADWVMGVAEAGSGTLAERQE